MKNGKNGIPNAEQMLLFEENYLIREVGLIAQKWDIALTELVANAWDAGAFNVKIRIPYKCNSYLEIEDDGSGMTDDEFKNRWMMLRYNRLLRQGKNAEFPPGRKEESRIAYGRNGVGRHGLLCFNDEYEVLTAKHGIGLHYTIGTSSTSPFLILDKKERQQKKEGTKLRVKVERNLPNADRLLEILSARFLHDPRFIIKVNGKAIIKEKHAGKISEKKIKINKDISLTAMFFDSTKTAHKSSHQGIAFWVGNRLVGESSWRLGKNIIIDGRLHFAKTYTFIIKTEGLDNYVRADWSGFKEDDILEKVYEAVSEFVDDCLGQVARKNIIEIKGEVKKNHSDDLKQLSALGRFEVDEFIEDITIKHPTMRPEYVSTAVEAVINIEKSRSGVALLEKLSHLSDDDIDGLNDLLENWTIKDALCVLDEIGRRLSVIEAIRRFSDDKDIDELHTLHPLITQSRWLFGPEFDSPEYASNNQLRTAVKKIFGKDLDKDAFENCRKRPDFAILSGGSISAVSIDEIDEDSGLVSLKKVLLIELKKGGSSIGRKERNQAIGYVEDFLGCGSLIGNPYVYAYVVGAASSGITQPLQTVRNKHDVEVGRVRITTFHQLVDTAERRLFNLREKLEGYDEMSDEKLMKKIQPEIF